MITREKGRVPSNIVCHTIRASKSLNYCSTFGRPLLYRSRTTALSVDFRHITCQGLQVVPVLSAHLAFWDEREKRILSLVLVIFVNECLFCFNPVVSFF